MPSIYYPESISPYVYRNGFDKICEHALNDKSAGAFAFYMIPISDKSRAANQQAYFKAISRNPDAGYMLDRAHSIGVALVLNGGQIKLHKVPIKQIRNSGKTKDDVVKSMVQSGWPIDPQKFCDPAAMYRPAVW